MDSLNRGSTPSEKDWPALLRDSSRTGGQNSQAFKKPAGARWQAKVDGNVRAAPILRDRFLYVTSLSGYLHAIDVATGRLGWKYKAGAAIHSTPSLSGKRVLFGCGDGNVYAVDSEAGTKLWNFTAAGEVWASPVVRSRVTSRLKRWLVRKVAVRSGPSRRSRTQSGRSSTR